MAKGIIIKVNGGNFYLKENDNIVICRASGKLRDFRINPVCGDIATYTLLEDGKGYITGIEDRKNYLIRPPVSNIDQALVVTSLSDPDFSSLLLEKLLVQIIDNNITPIIYFSKVDKVNFADYMKYYNYYNRIGIKCYYGNSLALENTQVLKDIFAGKVTILTGQSGAGKSTLLNALDPNLNLKTNEISKSLGRGKHTTREVEFRNIFLGLVADTPGFSSLRLDISKERLASIYPGFNDFNKCKFRSCKHDKEIGCMIKKEVEEGTILLESYNNYLKILNDVQKGGKE